jgi:hypothetical protein
MIIKFFQKHFISNYIYSFNGTKMIIPKFFNYNFTNKNLNLNKINYPNTFLWKNNFFVKYNNNSNFTFSTKIINNKKQNKKLLYILPIISIFGYNYYLYLNNETSPEIYFCYPFLQSIISKTDKIYKIIYNYSTQPYNSFLLLDKLQPALKGVEKTLVLNLNKTLISYHYSLLSGFEILKRPGLTTFINELSKYYEIVLFSNEDNSFVEDIANKLDPTREKIKFRLGKESLHYYKGKSIKDLDYLNRNLNDIIVLDYDLDNVKKHPENTIIIPEFNGDGKDRELLFAIAFLKEMAKQNVVNVRDEIKKWGNYKPYFKYYQAHSKYKKLLPGNYDKDIYNMKDDDNKSIFSFFYNLFNWN